MISALCMAALFCGAFAGKESYTNNFVCRPLFCIDPVFPAFPAIAQLETKQYECQDTTLTSRSMLHFCYEPVTYAYNLPKPEPGADPEPIVDIVKRQEQEAVTYYSYHLNGMGYEFWENTEPWRSEDPCVRSVWEMTCFTFFPRCNDVNDGVYLKPCRSSCENYRKNCRVECCDESVSCVFEHTVMLQDGSSSKSTGYIDHHGPSELCTGGSARLFSGAALLLLCAHLFAVAHS